MSETIDQALRAIESQRCQRLGCKGRERGVNHWVVRRHPHTDEPIAMCEPCEMASKEWRRLIREGKSKIRELKVVTH